MFTIRPGSWHYRLASYVCNPRHIPSLCPYVRKVALGAALLSFISAFVGGILIANILGIADAFNGLWGAESPFAFVNTLTGAGIMAILLTEGCYKFSRWRSDRKYAKRLALREAQAEVGTDYVPPQPSLISVWWESVHEKICPPIKVEGHDPRHYDDY